MGKAFATLVDDVEEELQDSGNSLWTAAEVGSQIERAIREVSAYRPYETQEEFEFETRTGKATATTSGALVDSTNAEFRSSDVGKVIYNTTDRTWATVTAYVSSSQLTLSDDIMALNEEYKMFNQDCKNNRQIYLGDIEDNVGPDRGVKWVEWKIDRFPRKFRGFRVDGKVLTVDIASQAPDSGSTDAAVEVHVGFRRRHQVSQLTDLVGTANGAEVAGATSMDFADLSGSEVVAEDTEFVIAGVRGRYRVTEAVTLSSGGTSTNGLNFWPPVESAIDNGDVVTITGSTLDRELERLVMLLAAGRVIRSKGNKLLQQADAAITSVSSVTTALGLVAVKVAQAVTDLASGRTELAKADTVVDSAATEIGLINARIDDAVSTLGIGGPHINTITKGGPNVPNQFVAQAAQELNTARGYFEAARAYMEQASADESQAQTYARHAAGEIAAAQGSVNEALGYLQKIQGDLAITDRTAEYASQSRAMVRDALRELRQGNRPKTTGGRFPRD